MIQVEKELRFCIEYVCPTHPYNDDGSVNVRYFRTLSEEEAENALVLLLECGCKLIDLYKGNVQDGKLAEWITPMIVSPDDWWKGDYFPYRKLVGNISIAFMDYLDKIKPDGKMCLSNMECADIDKAFYEMDWEKLYRYLKKYSKDINDGTEG